jgi:hypothetical protein
LGVDWASADDARCKAQRRRRFLRDRLVRFRGRGRGPATTRPRSAYGLQERGPSTWRHARPGPRPWRSPSRWARCQPSLASRRPAPAPLLVSGLSAPSASKGKMLRRKASTVATCCPSSSVTRSSHGLISNPTARPVRRSIYG